MAEQASANPKVMHAIMREVQAGLFSAEYPGDLDPHAGDVERRLDTHIGTDAQSVKFWVEEMALSLGFEQVIWDELPAQLIR